MTLQELSRRFWPSSYAFLLGLAIVGYPLIAATALAVGGYSRITTIGYRAGLLTFAVAIIVMASIRQAYWPRLATIIVGALWVSLFIRFVWDATVVPIPMDLPWDNYLLQIIGVSYLPALALVRVPGAMVLDQSARIIQLLGTVSAILIGVHVLATWQDFMHDARIGAESLNPISIGHLGASVVIVSWLSGSREASRFATAIDSKLVRAICGLIGFSLVIVSASRGPALALFGAALFWFFMKIHHHFGLSGIILSSTAVVALVTGTSFVVINNADLYERLPIVERIVNVGFDQSTSDRVRLISGALQQFEESPLFGGSFVEPVERFYPHNIVAEALMATGFPGFLLLAMLLCMIIWACIAVVNTKAQWLALLAVQYLIGAMISGSLYFSAEFWALAVAVIGIAIIIRKSEKLVA